MVRLVFSLIAIMGCFLSDGAVAKCAFNPFPENAVVTYDYWPILSSENGKKYLQIKPESKRRNCEEYYEVVLLPNYVSPKDEYGNRDWYVPYDLTDAWREMDKAIPQEYIDLVLNNYDVKSCQVFRDDNERIAFSLAKLTESFRAHWFFAINGRLSVYLAGILNNVNTRILYGNSEENMREAEEYLFVDGLMCGFLRFKKTGKYMSHLEFVERYRESIKKENAKTINRVSIVDFTPQASAGKKPKKLMVK